MYYHLLLLQLLIQIYIKFVKEEDKENENKAKVIEHACTRTGKIIIIYLCMSKETVYIIIEENKLIPQNFGRVLWGKS